MRTGFVLGYDPGGNDAHGMAALKVREVGGRWTPTALEVGEANTLHDAVEWLNTTCRDGRILATGVDTLSEWNSGPSGWRPADCWLRDRYPAMAPCVVAVAHLHALLGSPADFPFHLVRVTMHPTAAYTRIRDLPRGSEETAGAVREALLGEPLFEFPEYHRYPITGVRRE